MRFFFSYALIFLFASGMLLPACRQESHWERTLVGPFQGEPYKGEPLTPAVSSIPLSSKFVLYVHWEGATDNPIICLRESKGTSDRKSTRLNSSHLRLSRMPSSA